MSPATVMQSILCFEELLESHSQLFVETPKEFTLVSKTPEIPKWTEQREKTELIRHRLEQDLPKVRDFFQDLSKKVAAAAHSQDLNEIYSVLGYTNLFTACSHHI